MATIKNKAPKKYRTEHLVSGSLDGLGDASGLFVNLLSGIMQSGLSVLGNAVSWCANLLSGTLATAVAILAMASLGFALIQGRIGLREGLRITLGCFILFGAPIIAKGLIDASWGYHQQIGLKAGVVPAVAVPSAAPQFDPYAGAALPR